MQLFAQRFRQRQPLGSRRNFGAMEFAEALLALGIDGASEWETLSAQGLRRAYLKQVRAHPPERDAQGFQRVREAYELLQALEPTRTAPRGSGPLMLGTAANAEMVARAPGPEAAPAERVAIRHESGPGRAAFERLQQALSAGQDDIAGDALLELYTDAALTNRRPVPQLVLSVIAKQFMRGAQDRGRRLLLAFEEDIARWNDGPLSTPLAANWKLLTELATFSDQVPQASIGALARAIESGDFQEATEALRAEADARDRQGRMALESFLKASAPTLYEAAWPKPRGLFQKQQPNDERWARRIFYLMIVIASPFTYHLLEGASSRRASQSQTAANSTRDARSSERDATAHATNRVANLGAPSGEQAKELQSVTTKLEKVLRFSRCHQLLAAWADYAAVVRRLNGYESVMSGYEAHRVEGSTTCPQLASELRESP